MGNFATRLIASLERRRHNEDIYYIYQNMRQKAVRTGDICIFSILEERFFSFEGTSCAFCARFLIHIMTFN
jgi:hypothetical protein